MGTNQATGRLGEQYAYDHVKGLGFSVLDTNVRTKMGEIDIIATRAGKVHFIEVKTRVGDGYGKPYEAVNYHKMRHMLNSARIYTLQNGLSQHKLSLDVVSIVLHRDNTIKTLTFYENITQ